MRSTIEKVSSNRVKLTLELTPEAFEEAMQKSYLKTRGTIMLPGFRKGKAPRKLIERMYGESMFYEEAFDLVFPDMYAEALKEHDARAVGQPDVAIDKIGGGEPLTVTAEVYVWPDVNLPEYKGLNVRREDDTVDEDAVDQEIARVRQRNGRDVEVSDRPAQDDDIITLDYTGTVDGVSFEGGTAENAQLTIGSGQFIPGFEEKVIGMSIGEERDIEVTFPAEYHAEELAGKAASFHVKLHAIRVRELSDLDDEFAKDVSEFSTFEEYKADVRTKLSSEAAKRADSVYETALVDAVAAGAEIEIPPPMIERQIDALIRDLALRMAYQGLSLEDYMRYTDQTIETLREQRSEQAEKLVRGELVLDAIQKAEGIEPTPADIDSVTAQHALNSGKTLEEFTEALTDEQKTYIKDDARTYATIEFLKKHAVGAE
ncbi:MAG: trigger factor [Clostridia bacterium]|nr:trigger factor [Clostridia bacterium]